MKLTKQLREWAIKSASLATDAADEVIQAAVTKALTDGTLSPEKFAELSTTPADQEASEFASRVGGLEKKFDELLSRLEARTQPQEDEVKKTDETKKPEAKTHEGNDEWKKSVEPELKDEKGLDRDSLDVRVKGAHEQYSTQKSAAMYPQHTKKGGSHPLAGQPIQDFTNYGRQIDTPSDLDKAVAGAWAKFTIAASQRGSKQLAFMSMNDHDKGLLMHAIKEMSWGGASDGGDWADIANRKLTDFEQKALIDDATSGGLEAAPIAFDDMVIQTPLLTGELFPRVNTVPLDRGRRVEGVATGTVTASWGGIDDTAISLFNTASYVSAFDTTIYRWEGAIHIGLDFLSDTPIDFGAHITQQYGERLMEDLDDVIAAGNGTTQPEGVINKSGTTSVNFGGSTSLGNYESLRFGVSKAEHNGGFGASACFVGTETSYQRARAIPVGASDARRLGGMDYSSYRWMERDYALNESLTNAQIAYFIGKRYRMYRRRGLTMRTSTEGDTLIRKNAMLIVATARWGGQLERGAVAAVTTTAPA